MTAAGGAKLQRLRGPPRVLQNQKWPLGMGSDAAPQKLVAKHRIPHAWCSLWPCGGAVKSDRGPSLPLALPVVACLQEGRNLLAYPLMWGGAPVVGDPIGGLCPHPSVIGLWFPHKSKAAPPTLSLPLCTPLPGTDARPHWAEETKVTKGPKPQSIHVYLLYRNTPKYPCFWELEFSAPHHCSVAIQPSMLGIRTQGWSCDERGGFQDTPQLRYHTAPNGMEGEGEGQAGCQVPGKDKQMGPLQQSSGTRWANSLGVNPKGQTQTWTSAMWRGGRRWACGGRCSVG